MKHFIFSSFFQSPRHFHKHRKDAFAAGTSEGNGASDRARRQDVCPHSSSYLGVRLSQRCSRVHQKLAHSPVPLAGSLVQCGLTPKSKMKWETTHKGVGGRGGSGGGGGREGVRVASYPCCWGSVLVRLLPYPQRRPGAGRLRGRWVRGVSKNAFSHQRTITI